MNSHSRLLKLGLDTNPVSATQLLKSLTTLGSPHSLSDAHRLFNQVPFHSRDAVLWTALISFSAHIHHPTHALRLFSLMLQSPCRPNAFTLTSAARAAAAVSSPHTASTLHSFAIKLGVHSNVIVATAILDMHSKCVDLASSRNLFDEMPHRNIVTWNSMIAGYTTAGMGVPALGLFYRMRCQVGCDEFSVASGLTACAGLGDVRSGAQIHAYLVSAGFDSDSAVASAKANMYFRCGDVESAKRAMEGREEDGMTKLMMIKGYVFNEIYDDAIQTILHCGGFAEIVRMDYSVVVSVLTACGNLRLLGIGRQMHGAIIIMGVYDSCDSPGVVECVLMDMYCKCSSIKDARCVFDTSRERCASHWNSMITGFIHNHMLDEAWRFFDDMPDKNVISWTAMISGYIQQGFPLKGLQLLARLHGDSGLMRGNCYTFATAIDACSRLGALGIGKQVHAQSLRTCSLGGIDNVVVETALVDMYSKTGNLNYARKVFGRMRKKNVVSWTSMIDGYTSHGLGLEAIEVLDQMIREGCKPNEVTFLAVLGACSHCGLVDQGIHYFNMMRDKYGIVPGCDHYTCMVDMLGRAGRLVEAWNFVEEIKAQKKINDDMESSDADAIYGALLGGCRLHGDVEMGCKVAKEMLKKKHQTSDTYVALSNVYAAAEMWEKVSDVREQWKRQGIVKEAGHTQIHG